MTDRPDPSFPVTLDTLSGWLALICYGVENGLWVSEPEPEYDRYSSRRKQVRPK